MSYPILYPTTETAFASNGLGVLSSATYCRAKTALNGMMELEMHYPVQGLHFADLAEDCILLARPDPVSELQPYRIYRITKPMGKQVTVYAHHLAYDLQDITVSPFEASGAVLACEGLVSNADVPCPFTFYTDKSTQGTFTVQEPKSIWGCLAGSEGSLLDTFAGEYEFDRYTVKLLQHRGSDHGVSIRYGKNLTDLVQDRNIARVCTGVRPYWKSQEGELVMLPEKILYADGTYTRQRIRPLDLSEKFEEKPTAEQLRAAATKYMHDNQVGTPAVSWKVSFAQLEKTVEYRGKALLERVLLGDDAAVEFPSMGVSAKARAVEIDYDCLRDRYESVTLGRVKSTIADTIVDQQAQLDKKPDADKIQSQLQQQVGKLTDALLGATGGAVRLLDTDGDNYPDTLYIADSADPAQANKVWRFNYQGWGASTNGYNGPFILGASFDSGIMADFITAGTLDANLIKAGVLQSLDGNFRFNLVTGEIYVGGYAMQNDVDGVAGDVANTRTELNGVKGDVSDLREKSNGLSLTIQDILDNGVDQVVTRTGYRFDADGLKIRKAGDEIENKIDNTGMYVTRSGETMLQANAAGVVAADVTVKNYLVVGEHARFEKYTHSDGTEAVACYFV